MKRSPSELIKDRTRNVIQDKIGKVISSKGSSVPQKSKLKDGRILFAECMCKSFMLGRDEGRMSFNDRRIFCNNLILSFNGCHIFHNNLILSFNGRRMFRNNLIL